MYGVYWCPHCQEQKAKFGTGRQRSALRRVRSPGREARPDLCTIAGVRNYPTWVIGNRRHEGILTLEELARISGFAGPAAAKSGS